MKLLVLAVLFALPALAGCERMFGTGKADEGQVALKINQLQIAIEKRLEEEEKATVGLLAVVDTTRIAAAVEEAAEQQDSPAHKRERVVRQELNNRLVANRFFTLLLPEAEQIAQCSAQVLELNSAALTASLAMSSGEAMQAGYVINVLIDKGGEQVYLAVQETAGGSIIYQDTISGWSEVLSAAEATEAEGGEA